MKRLPDHRRCNYYSRQGYRCRLPAAEFAGFCAKHLNKLAAQENAVAVSTSDLPLQSAVGIHQLLVNVATALANNRITARSATAMGYLGQVLLLSLDRVRVETAPKKMEDDLAEYTQRNIESAWAQYMAENPGVAQFVARETTDEGSPDSEPATQPEAPPAPSATPENPAPPHRAASP